MDATQASATANIVKDQVGERCQKLFQDFLEEYSGGDGENKYLKAVGELSRPERNTLSVSFEELESHNQQLSTLIMEEYHRVYPFMCRGLSSFAQDRCGVPTAKELYISLTDVPYAYKVRDMSTAKIGTLMRITGQVVRTHPVHPELISGTFVCLDCQTVTVNVEQQFKYTQPSICRNPACNNRQRFVLDVNKSKFVDFQKVRVQETQAELPRGSIPRSVEIILRAESVETAQAGDKCDFIGTLIVVPDVGAIASQGAGRVESGSRTKGDAGFDTEAGVSGLKSLGVRELGYRLAFLACTVVSSGSTLRVNEEEMSPEEIKKSMSEAEWKKVYDMSQDKSLYTNLCNSLFPTIHGNDEIKRGILLQLFGGVRKQTEEGTMLRGDINICIVGDPSTAKSQLLKQVEEMSPRAVYTSGQSSSAAGLTAAVVKDEESFEFVIEAGALMLADNGVCCIDEFDKMDAKDQVAIHEAMEQQTISITKAGVKATLNARTSILAAANPVGGRYDKSRSLRQNINMSAPIMSRFDLFFVLLDECNEVTDYSIARHIVELHRCAEQCVTRRVYSREDIDRYLQFARQFKPKLCEEAQQYLVDEYRRLRQRDGAGSAAGARGAWRVTVRQLESMIRLSEAMARMHCMDEVQTRHVKETIRLLNKCMIRVESPDVELEEDDSSAPQPSQDDNESTNAESGSVNGDTQTREEKTKLRVSYEQYRRTANLLLHRLQQLEQSQDTDSCSKSSLIGWYLEQLSDEIQTEAELIQQKQLVQAIIQRLITHDGAVLELRPAADSMETDDDTETDSQLVLHPNYNLQE